LAFRPLALDEIQRAPGLLPAIEAMIDAERRRGGDERRRFLLTGSADILPSVSESLAGLVQIATLWPLWQGELAGKRERFLGRIFESPLERPAGGSKPADLVQRILRGGFPDAVRRPPARRQEWLRRRSEYRRSVPRVWATPIDHEALSQPARAALPPRPDPRMERQSQSATDQSEKLFLSDSAMHASLIGVTAESLRRDRNTLGPLLEGFVAMELIKQASWSEGI
jgi:predicted AAA+ superfamily ATPase